MNHFRLGFSRLFLVEELHSTSFIASYDDAIKRGVVHGKKATQKDGCCVFKTCCCAKVVIHGERGPFYIRSVSQRQ